MKQIVQELTREKYLLDLFLTDIAGAKVEVGPMIADHKFLHACIPLPEVHSLQVIRKRFNLKKAKWSALKVALSNFDWSPLKRNTVEDAASFFLDALWTLLCCHIPYEEVTIKKRSHPWLNAACEEAIAAKNAAEGTDTFEMKRKECAEILAKEYQEHLKDLKKRNSN